jgi:hypothetical protein
MFEIRFTGHSLYAMQSAQDGCWCSHRSGTKPEEALRSLEEDFSISAVHGIVIMEE